LAGLKGSDPRKLALAELLWKQTTVSQEWIAGRTVNAQRGEREPAAAAAGSRKDPAQGAARDAEFFLTVSGKKEL
jgi:hypothetical protein